MGELKMEEMSLPSLFEQARKIHHLASESSVDKETLRKGCEALKRCEEMISRLGLFSSNETKDDISTTNIKYLLVPFYLAELTEKIAQDDRIQILKALQAKLKEFISFCDAMELVPQEELETSAQEGPNSFVNQRAKKIARFKRQRAAESKLLEIKERKERRGRSTKASALSAPVEAGDDDEVDDDGEEERKAWLTSLSLAICKAFDLLEMIKKEEEMLSAIKEKRQQEGDIEVSQAVLEERAKTAEDWHRAAAARARYTKPAQPITCATFAQDVLEGRAKVSEAHDHKHPPMMFGPASLVGGSLTSERERMAAQVFQPGHRWGGETIRLLKQVATSQTDISLVRLEQSKISPTVMEKGKRVMVGQRWAVDFTDNSTTPATRDIPDPPGFTRASHDQDDSTLSRQKKDVEPNWKAQKAWEVAQSPFKNLLMMGFMMWMAGSTVHLFSIGITFSALWQPISALQGLGKLFEPYKDKKVDLLAPKLLFIALNLGGMAFGVWKLNTLGLLPTNASDWVSSLPPAPEVEYSSGGMNLW